MPGSRLFRRWAMAVPPRVKTSVKNQPLAYAAPTTIYNALRRSGAMPDDLVGVLGFGGLRHIGIQFASKFGYKVVAIRRASENAALAKKLRASVYINDERNCKIGLLVEDLTVDPIEVTPVQLISGS